MNKLILFIVILLLVNASVWAGPGGPPQSTEGLYNGSQKTQIVGDSPQYPSIVHDGALTTIPYTYSISHGSVFGHTPFYKIGYSPAASTSETALWNPATAYVFPTTPMGMEVVSSSVEDDTGGTGAIMMHIVYLDGDYVQHSEHITLNGTAAVPTVAQDIFRINSFHADTFGTACRAVGNVSIRHLSDSPIYSQLGAGFASCRCSVYTVPADTDLYINSIVFSAAHSTSGKSERITLQASRTPDGETSTNGLWFWPYSEIMLVDGVYRSPESTLIHFGEKTDMYVSVVGEINAKITSELRGWTE